jgi:hypothetical protein
MFVSKKCAFRKTGAARFAKRRHADRFTLKPEDCKKKSIHHNNICFPKDSAHLEGALCFTVNPNGEVNMKKAAYLILAASLISGFMSVHSQDQEFATRFERIVEQYMNTKDGLVHNRTDLASAWAERLETSLSTAPNNIFPEDKLPLWQEMREVMVRYTGKIVDSESITVQREALAELSAGIKNFIDEFGNPGGTLYVIKCRHYGDKEVVWLSRSNRVANPYFGPEKMNCGEVVAEL